jgi:hypothetical protein
VDRFEFLAFKSDVGHWRKTDKNLVGVSLRSIITNVVTQVRVRLGPVQYSLAVPDALEFWNDRLSSLLYLLDSGEQTSKMILLTNGM